MFHTDNFFALSINPPSPINLPSSSVPKINRGFTVYDLFFCSLCNQSILFVIFFAVTTEYASGYPVWKSGRNTEAPFTLKATIHYPEERILYPYMTYMTFQSVQVLFKHKPRQFIDNCRILPTLDRHLCHFEISFSGSSDTNHDSLLNIVLEHCLHWTATFEIFSR